MNKTTFIHVLMVAWARRDQKAGVKELRGGPSTLALLCHQQPCNTGKSNVPSLHGEIKRKGVQATEDYLVIKGNELSHHEKLTKAAGHKIPGT